jgi:uncharacterized protein YgiM (DUF1202 family)
MMGVTTGWTATSVSAQDEEVTAAAITPGTNAVVSNGPLNQRSTASLSGGIVQVLATGNVVAVISGPTSANGYNWYYVSYNGISGYVAGQYLSATGFNIGDNVYVNSNNVNVRSGAGTGNPVIDQLNYGALGQVIGGPTTATGYVWYQIQYETTLTGWVAGTWLSLSSTPPSGNFGINSWILVDDPPVNFRSGPGTGYNVILSLKSNQAVQVTGSPVTGTGYTWYPVNTVGGTSGYVVQDYFEGGFYLNAYAVVDDGPLNLRATASSTGTIIGSIPDNASVYVNNQSPVYQGGQSWFNVTYNGTTGWVAGSYLAPPV